MCVCVGGGGGVPQVVWAQVSASGILNHITVNRSRDENNRNLQEVRDITPNTAGDVRVDQMEKIKALTTSVTTFNYSAFMEYLLCADHSPGCRATR